MKIFTPKHLYSHQRMKMKKILLTGGAGYIGSHIAVSLINSGFDPVVVDDFSNSYPSVISAIESIVQKPIKFYEADCGDIKSLRNIIEIEGGMDGVIHLAAYKAVGESVEKPLKYYRNNLGSMQTVLQVIKEFNVPNFVFSSSCTVYGNAEEQPVTETTPWQPAFSPYGYTKQVCERMMTDFQKAHPGVKQVSLRYFNPIGAHPSGKIGELPIGTPNNLVPFITQVAAGIRDKLTIFGKDYNTPDGTCIRDYIHVCDLADAHVKALSFLMQQPQNNLWVFNVGTGKGVSVKELVDEFEKVNRVTINYEYGNRREGDVEAIYANSDLANEKLNWQAGYGIGEALQHAWKWQQNLEKQ